jgi:ribosomal protein S18 acetylase RimI-like enzyme
MTVSIRQAEGTHDVANARRLFQDYAASLDFDLCFQSFDQELAQLPGYYAPPRGRLLLAFENEQLVGVVALRPLPDAQDLCEMKRLYVRPEFRGRNIARALLERLFSEARAIGYRRMRLDTVRGTMDAAISLYRQYGFQEIGAYTVNPNPGVLYMELDLQSATISKGVL